MIINLYIHHAYSVVLCTEKGSVRVDPSGQAFRSYYTNTHMHVHIQMNSKYLLYAMLYRCVGGWFCWVRVYAIEQRAVVMKIRVLFGALAQANRQISAALCEVYGIKLPHIKRKVTGCVGQNGFRTRKCNTFMLDYCLVVYFYVNLIWKKK